MKSITYRGSLNKSPSKLLMSAVLGGLLLCVHAHADTVFTRVDAAQFRTVVQKLATATADITDSSKQAAGNNIAISNCLSGIHEEAMVAVLHLTSVWRLLAVAAAMRDKTDELMVLAALSDALKPASAQLTNSRQIINGWMALCSQSATVNVKGQTVINIFFEIQQALAPVSDKVQKTSAF